MARRCAFGIGHGEKRQVVIHRAAGRAAVGGEEGFGFAPGKSRGAAVFQRGERDLHEVINHDARVTVNVRLVGGGNVHAEQDSAPRR